MPSDLTAHTLFKRQFGHPPVHEVRAPAALTLLGRAAAGNEGLILTAAIDRYLHLAAAPRADGKIELIQISPEGRETFWVSNLAANPQAPWADVMKSVLVHLRKRGVPFNGFNAVVQAGDNQLFLADRSSQAPLAAATALMIRKLYPFSLGETGLGRPPERNAQGKVPEPGLAERLHIARLCANALSTPDSFAEIATVLGGKAWHLLSLDLRSGTAEHLPLIGGILALSFPEERADYNREETRQLLAAGASTLGIRSWRTVELPFLEASRERLSLRACAAARAVVNDNILAVASERGLRLDDQAQFGHCLVRSEDNWSVLLGGFSPRQRLVVETARAHPASLAAVRLPQAPDVILHLLRHHLAPGFGDHLANHFKALTGKPLKTIFCQVTDAST